MKADDIHVGKLIEQFVNYIFYKQRSEKGAGIGAENAAPFTKKGAAPAPAPPP